MASWTHLGTTFNTTAGNKTVVATPAVGDLIVIVSACTGVAGSAPSDNNADGLGTYTQIGVLQSGFSTTGNLTCWVRNALVGSATSTTFTASQASSTGGGLSVLSAAGMTRFGSSAIRSTGGQSGVAAGTPAPVLNQTPLSANPILTVVCNGTNSTTTVTPRTGYTEAFDNGYATPATGLEVAFLNSGETSATLTQGSTTATQFASFGIELDTSLAATFDAASTQTGASVSTINWAHTCTGTNCALLVDVAVGTSAGGDTKTVSVTYSGVAMTSLGKRHAADSTAGFIERFVLVAPATGSNSIVVSLTPGTAVEIVGGAMSFNTASQTLSHYSSTTTTDATFPSGSTGTAASVTTIGPVATDSLAMGGHGAGNTFSAVAQTSRYNVTGTTSTGCGNLAGNTTPGTGATATLSATVSAADSWASIITEIKVAGTAAPAELPIVTMSPRIPV